MTYRDNSVSFSLSGTGYSLKSGSFTIDSFSVTSGQDPDRNIHRGLKKSLNDKGSMTFRVGRHGDKKTAKWFNKKIPASQTTFNHSAGKLNFAFLGTLKLKLTGGILGGGQDTYTFSNIGIAQGHSFPRNNWWFGGQNCAHISSNSNSNSVFCTGVNSSGSIVTFMFLRGGNGVSTIDVTPITLVGTRDWMGKINDNVALDQLMMPGSHDAGMSETHHCDLLSKIGTGYVKTQGGSVGDQLVNGSRYFDIRVDYDHDELVTYHRSGKFGCNGQDLKDVLDETVAFLKAHSTETAIIKISHIRNDRGDRANIKAKINKLLTNSYSSAMYSNNNKNMNLAELALGDVRGKMIVVFDYSQYIDPSTGRFRYKDGFDSDDNCITKTNANLTVYDKYSKTAFYGNMKKDQLKKWNKSAALGAGRLFLLSWTLTPLTHVVPINPLDPVVPINPLDPVLPPPIKILAKEANSKLPGVLYEQIVTSEAKKPNVVYIDFVDSPTAQSIIQYNF